MADTDWDILAQLFYQGAWHTLPALVPGGQGVKFGRGVADDLDLKQSTAAWRILDDDDLYRPSNAASALYGVTGAWMPAAFATGGVVRWTGETTKMQPGQTDDLVVDASNSVLRGLRWVDVSGSGTLGRVGKWRDPLSSPLTTQIATYAATLRGFWPLEDGSDATQLSNLLVDGRPGSYVNVRLAAADGPGGADKAPELSSSGTMTFPFAAMSNTAGFQIAFAAEILNMDATLRDIFTFRTTAGLTFRWQASTTVYGWKITDSAENVLMNTTSTFGGDGGPGQWVYHRLKVSRAGTTVTVEPSWYSEAAENFWGITDTYTGSMGSPTTGSVPANVATAGAHYSHVFGVTGVADDLESGAFTDAFRGYSGEFAADRFDRMCTSRSLPFLVRGSYSGTPRMGKQPIATVQDILRQIRATSGGLIFDRGDNLGVVLVTRGQLNANAASPWELTWPDDIGPGLTEVTGYDVFNLITASNQDGATFTRELETGRLGTQDPPTGSGRLDKKVDVNLADDAGLADVASWWLNFYTQDKPRFGQLVIDLDANPGLLDDANAAEPGTFIRLSGRTPDPLLLMITWIDQATIRKRNIITLTVVPGDVYDTAVYDDTGSRYDSATTTASAALTDSATAWTVWTTDPLDVWSITATPYDWLVDGERVTVGTMGAATFNSTAGAWEQDADVTRAVNGVVRAHAAGASIRLADPKRYG